MKIKSTKSRTYTGMVRNVGKKIKLKGGSEYDALTTARKYYCYLKNSGVAKKIKRGYNKRFRKEGKCEAKDIE